MYTKKSSQIKDKWQTRLTGKCPRARINNLDDYNNVNPSIHSCSPVIEIISRIRIFRRESKQDLVIHPNVVRLSSNEAFCCRKFTTSFIMKGQLKNQHLASQTV